MVMSDCLLQVLPSSEFLTVTEGGYPANYTLRPTVPVLCPTDWDISGGMCVCELRISVYESPLRTGDSPGAFCPEDGSKTIHQTVIKQPRDAGAQECGVIIPEV